MLTVTSRYVASIDGCWDASVMPNGLGVMKQHAINIIISNEDDERNALCQHGILLLCILLIRYLVDEMRYFVSSIFKLSLSVMSLKFDQDCFFLQCIINTLKPFLPDRIKTTFLVNFQLSVKRFLFFILFFYNFFFIHNLPSLWNFLKHLKKKLTTFDKKSLAECFARNLVWNNPLIVVDYILKKYFIK